MSLGPFMLFLDFSLKGQVHLPFFFPLTVPFLLEGFFPSPLNTWRPSEVVLFPLVGGGGLSAGSGLCSPLSRSTAFLPCHNYATFFRALFFSTARDQLRLPEWHNLITHVTRFHRGPDQLSFSGEMAVPPLPSRISLLVQCFSFEFVPCFPSTRTRSPFL